MSQTAAAPFVFVDDNVKLMFNWNASTIMASPHYWRRRVRHLTFMASAPFPEYRQIESGRTCGGISFCCFRTRLVWAASTLRLKQEFWAVIVEMGRVLNRLRIFSVVLFPPTAGFSMCFRKSGSWKRWETVCSLFLWEVSMQAGILHNVKGLHGIRLLFTSGLFSIVFWLECVVIRWPAVFSVFVSDAPLAV